MTTWLNEVLESEDRKKRSESGLSVVHGLARAKGLRAGALKVSNWRGLESWRAARSDRRGGRRSGHGHHKGSAAAVTLAMAGSRR